MKKKRTISTTAQNVHYIPEGMAERVPSVHKEGQQIKKSSCYIEMVFPYCIRPKVGSGKCFVEKQESLRYDI